MSKTYTFGVDHRGFYAEADEREYIPETLWRQLVEAGQAAGAEVANIAVNPVRLSITERVELKKFEGDTLVETITA